MNIEFIRVNIAVLRPFCVRELCLTLSVSLSLSLSQPYNKFQAFRVIYLDYVLRTSIDKMKENGSTLTKERSRRYPAHTITDADYTDDIALLANTPAQANCLERADGGIGLHVNADNMEFMCFNQTGDISTLNASSVKLVDKFTYLGSSVSSTETDINTWLAKAWTAIDMLSVIWMSDLTDNI